MQWKSIIQFLAIFSSTWRRTAFSLKHLPRLCNKYDAFIFVGYFTSSGVHGYQLVSHWH